MLGVIYLISAILIIFYRNIFVPKEMDAKARKRLLRFAFVLMVLLLGLRHPFESDSSDVTNYYNMFSRAIERDNFSSYFERYETIEIGYLWLNWCVSRIIYWPQAILFVHAIICCYFTLDFINRYSDDLLTTIVCFFSFGGLLFYATAFRQSIAISLCLFSVRFIKEKKLIKFILTVLLACTIHSTAFVFFPAYFLTNMKSSKSMALFDMAFVVALAMSSGYLVSWGDELLDMNYADDAFIGTYWGGLINLVFAVFVIVLMYASMPNSYIQKKLRSKRKYKDVVEIEDDSPIDYQFFHMMVVGTGIYALRFNTLALERVSFYFFTPMLYILFPQVLDKYLKKGKDDSIRILFLIVLLFLIIWRGREFDYTFFWQKISIY